MYGLRSPVSGRTLVPLWLVPTTRACALDMTQDSSTTMSIAPSRLTHLAKREVRRAPRGSSKSSCSPLSSLFRSCARAARGLPSSRAREAVRSSALGGTFYTAAHVVMKKFSSFSVVASPSARGRRPNTFRRAGCGDHDHAVSSVAAVRFARGAGYAALRCRLAQCVCRCLRRARAS